LLSSHRGEAFTSADAAKEYLDGLKQRIAQRGLTVNMTAIHFRADAPLADNISELRKQIMADAAAQAEKHGVRIVMKPHGGGSGASAEILRCLEKVAHPNFKIWYDAGNIIYYTGKDPVAELDPIAQHVTGFCAKDCPAPKGEVMSQFGTGKVDFKGVFAKLKSANFKGPIMVEGVKVGATAEETTANAKANREFLEKVLASV
jgi:sugar phosphate isomerase/epimerase